MTKAELLASIALVDDDDEILTPDGLPIVGVIAVDGRIYLVDEEDSDDADLKESVQAKGF